MNEWTPLLEIALQFKEAEGDDTPVNVVFTDSSEMPCVGELIALKDGGQELEVLEVKKKARGFQISVPARPLIKALEELGA